MSKLQLSPNPSGAGIVTLAAPNTASDVTLTLPAASGTVLTTASTFAGTGPAFSAYQSSAQTMTAGVSAKITFTTEDFDTASCFASSRFTPNVAGYYQLSAGVRVDTTISSLHVLLSASTVGVFAAGSFTNTSLASFMSSCSGLVYLNGSTDYVEVFAFCGNNVNLSTGRGTTYFSGFLARAA